ncbi:MAG: hypothetical protein ACLR2O_08945 [Coprococcus sp.]
MVDRREDARTYGSTGANGGYGGYGYPEVFGGSLEVDSAVMERLRSRKRSG